MKRMVSMLLIAAMLFCLASCGGNKEKEDAGKTKDGNYELALIVDDGAMDEGAFTDIIRDNIDRFAKEHALSAKCYQAEEAAVESYMAVIQKAVDKKAKLIILAGSNFETAVYTAQTMYPDVYFLLIDGVPNDGSNTYLTSENTVSIIFAEEEAGFLAGYAAVKDGYRKLGFLGGRVLPSVKRYGYGFVQGAAAASAELEENVEVRYQYTGSFEPSDIVKELAGGWYDAGTEIIFACGGDMGVSVMAAAEEKNGKVIGVDGDQSALSETVVTSAKKNLAVAIEDMMDQYVKDSFIGGTALTYAAKNEGISLEMEHAQFKTFSKSDYRKILGRLKNGEIELKKDTGISAVSELAGEWVTITE